MSSRCLACSVHHPVRSSPTEIGALHVGNWPVMNDSDEAELRALLLQRKPAHAIVGTGLDLVWRMADRPAAHGTIGKQLTSIIVPRARGEAVESDYHSAVNRHELLMADCCCLGRTPGSSCGMRSTRTRRGRSWCARSAAITLVLVAVGRSRSAVVAGRRVPRCAARGCPAGMRSQVLGRRRSRTR